VVVCSLLLTASGFRAQAGSSQKGTQRQSAAKSTPPPPPQQKKRKGPEQQHEGEEDDTPDLTEILQSFELPEAQLVFSFEELYKATSMRKTKVKLTGWMLVMSKLAEIQLESALSAASELEEKQAHVEKLTQQVEKLKHTINQQQSVIQGIQGLLQHSGPATTTTTTTRQGPLVILLRHRVPPIGSTPCEGGGSPPTHTTTFTHKGH